MLISSSLNSAEGSRLPFSPRYSSSYMSQVKVDASEDDDTEVSEGGDTSTEEEASDDDE